MILNKQKLKEALEIVKPGLSNKETIQQTSSFAFLGDRIVTYNDEISISHPLEGLEIEGAIPAENLYKFLGKIKKDEVELTLEGNEIIIVSGRSRAGLTIESEVKLPLQEISGDKLWQELPENFNKFMSFAMTACSRNSSEPILGCVNVSKEGFLEASDGFRIVQCHLGSEMPLKTFLMPSTSILQIVKIQPNLISEGNGWIHFKNEERTVISCRIFEGVFPAVEKHLEVKGTKIILPRTIDEILDRAMVFAKKDSALDENVEITIENRRLKIRAESESGWFEESANIQYEDEKIQFNITPFLLKDILNETQECLVGKDKLKFEGNGWKYMIALRM